MPAAHPTATAAYRADIDGLRAVAVLLVIGFHAFPGHVAGGFLGVDVFFVISGFLISTIILSGLERGTFSFGTFYARRVRRIFPALIAMFAGCAVIGWFVLLPDEVRQFGKYVGAGAAFVSNFVFWSESGYFDSGAESKLFLHLWSLAIEEQFYLLWPAMLVLAWRRRWPMVPTIAALTLASFAFAVWAVDAHPIGGFFWSPARAWELMVGGLLASIGAQPLATGFESRRDAMSLVGLALLGVSLLTVTRSSPVPGVAALAPVAGVALLLAAGPQAWVNRRLLSRPALVHIGLISYPLYLWHWPLLAFANIVVGEHPSPAVRITLIALSFGLAWLTYAVLERRLRFDVRATGPLVVVMGALWVGGITLYLGTGLPERLAPRDDAALSNPGEVPTMRTDGCITRHGLPDRSTGREIFCKDHPSGDAHREPWMLFGDSHALALWPALDAAHETLFIGADTCTYLREVNSAYVPYGQQAEFCPALSRAQYAQLERGAAGTVVLVARLALYLSGQGFGAIDAFPPGALAVSSDAFPGRGFAAFFEQALERDVRFMLEHGHRVILVLQTPELGFAPGRCGRHRPIEPLLGAPAHRCRVSRTVVDSRQAESRQAIAAVVERIGSDRITVVDPMDALCDRDFCYAERNGIAMYRDDDHLSLHGARSMWSHVGTAVPSIAHLRRDAPR